MLTLPLAQTIITAALAGPRTSPDKRLAVAVCDRGGHVFALAREPDAPPLYAHIAEAKAFTCMAYGRPTAELAKLAEEYPAWFQGIGHVAQTRMGLPLTASKGGVIITAPDGTILGAAGVSGETGDQDEVLARIGIAAAGLVAD